MIRDLTLTVPPGDWVGYMLEGRVTNGAGWRPVAARDRPPNGWPNGVLTTTAEFPDEHTEYRAVFVGAGGSRNMLVGDVLALGEQTVEVQHPSGSLAR